MSLKGLLINKLGSIKLVDIGEVLPILLLLRLFLLFFSVDLIKFGIKYIHLLVSHTGYSLDNSMVLLLFDRSDAVYHFYQLHLFYFHF